ncbi:hypothetical protein [Maribellus sp. YY47]|uniref:hypothetical protein n=1 Tax=Maribellus sp. YY47 TaxID=2929486 RepID=UPI0020015BED|nr:hypothetical protein [Maribellus sp. YY47]MCK3683360.1 hypothetical protein [Maribellus sp. YY47]
MMDKSVNWKYDNVWNTKWSLFDHEGIEIKYAGSSTNGRIESNSDDALLLITGLFVTNYYWQVSVGIMLAIFLPIWLNILR